ncbi:MAG: hypothetical protein JF603_00570 [Acidobacteria bacterium]|nr:hypothetical protein [Acidobacteriota bacterium]
MADPLDPQPDDVPEPPYERVYEQGEELLRQSRALIDELDARLQQPDGLQGEE